LAGVKAGVPKTMPQSASPDLRRLVWPMYLIFGGGMLAQLGPALYENSGAFGLFPGEERPALIGAAGFGLMAVGLAVLVAVVPLLRVRLSMIAAMLLALVGLATSAASQTPWALGGPLEGSSSIAFLVLLPSLGAATLGMWLMSKQAGLREYEGFWRRTFRVFIGLLLAILAFPVAIMVDRAAPCLGELFGRLFLVLLLIAPFVYVFLLSCFFIGLLRTARTCAAGPPADNPGARPGVPSELGHKDSV